MRPCFHFNLKYFTLAILLLSIEFFIAIYIHDDFIRPYIGDTLVVIFLYCFVKSFIKTDVIKTSLLILLFSFLVEILQYFDFIQIIGMQKSKIACILIGTSFSFYDLIAYLAGIMVIIYIEKAFKVN